MATTKTRKITSKTKEITYEVTSPIIAEKIIEGDYTMSTKVTVYDNGKVLVSRGNDVFNSACGIASLKAFIGILNEAISLSEKTFPQTK